MQVQHNEDQDTHAVIGGDKVRAFGISDNAEFITMLSEGLYSDKMMAVIREILCNAHDAHVMNKCLDNPIKITLTSDKLTITDFGPGIHDDVIMPIYCVYGNSTKTHNGEENGGFGLGSKAPFAYTSHFTVISKHKNVKTVYAVSRGSSETDGKPDMREIVSMPCTDSGLEVSLPIKNVGDEYTFENIIREVAFFGEMNVELNGEILHTLKFSQITEKFMMINHNSYEFLRNRRRSGQIYLRYGTVIYPISPESDFIDDYNFLDSILDNMRSNGSRIFIIQAQPNTIAVTPSRESISMTNKTKETIIGLLSEIVKKFQNQLLPAYQELVNESISYYIKTIKDDSKSNPERFLINHSFSQVSECFNFFLKKPIITPLDIIKSVLIVSNSHMTNHNSNFTILKSIRYKIIIDALLLHDPDNKDWYEAIKNIDFKNLPSSTSHQIYKVWNKTTLSKIKNVLSPTTIGMLRLSSKGAPNNTKNRLYQLSDIPSNRDDSEFFVKNKIIIGFNRNDIVDQGDYEPTISYDSYYAILLPRKKGVDESVIAELKAGGIEYIDARSEPVKKVKDPNIIKRPKGYIKLAEAIDSHGLYNSDYMTSTVITRIQRPIHVFHERTMDYKRVINNLENVSVKHIATLLPNAVVVSNVNTYSSLIKKGSFDGFDSLLSIIKNMFENEPDFIRVLQKQRQHQYGGVVHLLQKLIPYDKKIEKLFEDTYTINPKILSAIHIYNHINSHHNLGSKAFKLTRDVNDGILRYVEKDKFINSLNNNPLLAVVDINSIFHSFKNNNPNADKQLKLLHLALEQG